MDLPFARDLLYSNETNRVSVRYAVSPPAKAYNQNERMETIVSPKAGSTEVLSFEEVTKRSPRKMRCKEITCFNVTIEKEKARPMINRRFRFSRIVKVH